MEREGTSPAMVVARFMLLQVVLAAQNGPCAIEDRLIDHNPCERVRLPRVVQPDVDVYSPDEFDEIVRHMDPWCQAQVTVQGALVSGGANGWCSLYPVPWRARTADRSELLRMVRVTPPGSSGVYRPHFPSRPPRRSVEWSVR
jgi:hypothetical protein